MVLNEDIRVLTLLHKRAHGKKQEKYGIKILIRLTLPHSKNRVIIKAHQYHSQ